MLIFSNLDFKGFKKRGSKEDSKEDEIPKLIFLKVFFFSYSIISLIFSDSLSITLN